MVFRLLFKMVRRQSWNRYECLAAVLRDIRVESGMTQVDVAAKLRQPQSYVSKYESGERKLDLIQLEQVCEALDAPLVDVVKRFERKHDEA